jgi:hypothetical protein
LNDVTTLDQYMERYGALLGQQAERSLRPLHVPGRDEVVKLELLRQPFDAQQHVITATVKQLKRDKVAWVIAEMGSGKSIIAIGATHALAAGKPYRAIAMVPGQLTAKWRREIEETLPRVKVVNIRDWTDLTTLDRTAKPSGAEWYIIGRDRAKLGSCWRPCSHKRTKMHDARQGRHRPWPARRQEAELRVGVCRQRRRRREGERLRLAAVANDRQDLAVRAGDVHQEEAAWFLRHVRPR